MKISLPEDVSDDFLDTASQTFSCDTFLATLIKLFTLIPIAVIH